MSKLKEFHPLIGRTVDYHGEDMQIISVSQRRGRMVYIGRPFGSHLTYFMDPTKVQISNPSF